MFSQEEREDSPPEHLQALPQWLGRTHEPEGSHTEGIELIASWLDSGCLGTLANGVLRQLCPPHHLQLLLPQPQLAAVFPEGQVPCGSAVALALVPARAAALPAMSGAHLPSALVTDKTRAPEGAEASGCVWAGPTSCFTPGQCAEERALLL